MGQSERVPSWSCYHTTDITRCGQCGLIFCGMCHRVLISKGVSHPRELVTACPLCRGTVLIDLSPATPPLNDLGRPTVAPLDRVPAT